MRRRDFIILLAGAMTAWPLAGRAQQRPMPVIGYLSVGSERYYSPYVAAFRNGLKETGYVEGENVAIEYRWAEDHYDRLPALAADLVGRKVDLIAATGGNLGSHAAKNATSSIPIVFNHGGDPVAAGLIASLAHPGGNLTGVSFFSVTLSPKRLEFLSELVPNADVIAALVNPASANTAPAKEELTAAARAKGLQLTIFEATTAGEIEAAFNSLMQRRASAIVVVPDPFLDSRREQLVALAASHAVPAIYAFREFAASGGLISYGVSLSDVYRQLGTYAGKILNGAKPADLPVQQPTKFELVINLRTAKALGLTVPQSLLTRADEVIE